MTNVKKPIITLVGQKQARIGFSFLNEEPIKDCEKCALFKVCITNLEVGRIYSVITIRDKIFPCKIHEEGVRVTEVIEQNVEANIENRLAFPSGIITFQPQKCEEHSCINYNKCFPQGIKNGDKCKVIEIKRNFQCVSGRRLVSVILQLVSEKV